ncbi:hypothetical protein BMF94_5629 [Rhodotorula taiwanensis]|uniref:Uncharacterized protein n=1 Tax=Rhodotorula taiwanensis TaxID=741276 RepID=A0A2S5B3G1_9BASI|nr:hypothetical protein BMF94_5629 [Rhodotorula taiwanensis]
MPSADSPQPSLLSRLAPRADSTPPVEISPRPHHGAHSGGLFASSPASPPVGSPPFVGSPSRASRSPRKGNHFPRQNAQPVPHIAPLPDEVLSRSQPIPVERSTNSSRWASSPPVSSPPARSPAKQGIPLGTSSSPRSFGALGSTSPATRGSRAGGPASPPTGGRGSGQLESTVAQMQTTSLSPPPGTTQAFSPPRHAPPSPSFRAATSPHSPSALSHSPASNKLPPPASNPGRTPKKVLGGKSKWAQAGDDEPDEHASVAERLKEEQLSPLPADLTPKKRTSDEAKVSPLPVLGRNVRELADSDAGVEDLAKTPTPAAPLARKEAEPAPPPAEVVTAAEAQAEDTDDGSHPSSSESRRSSISSTASSSAPSQSGSHIDWADNDDDELPTLDDWGIDTSTYTAEEPAEAVASTSPTPSMPPLGTRRHSGRSRKSPPVAARVLPPAVGVAGPVHTPRAPPAKANGRLFASAARAATGAPDTPPHLARGAPSNAKPPSASVATPPTERSWRDRGAGAGPSPALFSRLSGMTPPAATGPTRKGGAGPTTPKTAESSSASSPASVKSAASRRSKRGKARAGGAKAADAPAAAAAAAAPAPNGKGGSKWA